MKKTICVFTGSRADYGLLRPLLTAIEQDRRLTLRILASGMHFTSRCGLTYKEIIRDGFTIDAKVDMQMTNDTKQAIASSVGLGIQKISHALESLRPDIVVILGDRVEALACAASAFLLHIPIAHLHGGEATYGVIDEGIRHAITKLSHLHFVSTLAYRQRVIQLGEDPRRVWHVGALGIDAARDVALYSRKEIEQKLGIRFKSRNLLITFHPQTLHAQDSKTALRALLDALDTYEDMQCIFTHPNADEGSKVLHTMINAYVGSHKDHAAVYTNLGSAMYLSCMREVDAVVGNSSSGIIEAPFYHIGTINIGDRQKGRIAAESVIHCGATTKAIRKAFAQLYSPEFQSLLKKVQNPYDAKASASEKIVRVLSRVKTDTLVYKEFYDYRSDL